MSVWRAADTEICVSVGTPGLKTKGPMALSCWGSCDLRVSEIYQGQEVGFEERAGDRLWELSMFEG